MVALQIMLSEGEMIYRQGGRRDRSTFPLGPLILLLRESLSAPRSRLLLTPLVLLGALLLASLGQQVNPPLTVTVHWFGSAS